MLKGKLQQELTISNISRSGLPGVGYTSYRVLYVIGDTMFLELSII